MADTRKAMAKRALSEAWIQAFRRRRTYPWRVKSLGEDALGLLPPDSDAGVDDPRVESVRLSRRVGPDGQVVFDLVAEVTQRRIRLGRLGGGADGVLRWVRASPPRGGRRS